jgi:hypothetical protein
VVVQMLQKLSPQSEIHADVKSCQWEFGTRVHVRLQADHLTVANPEEAFTWEGEQSLVDFDVAVTEDCAATSTIMKFDALIDGFVVARLRIDLQIARQATRTDRAVAETAAAQSAFASYASEDRLRVLDRLAEVRRSGLDVFVDCLSLHPGEEWKPRLEQEIKSNDLFLLFWSAHAKQSEWVRWEWQTALRHKGLSRIDPHPLDPVFHAEPPEELKALHFGDPYMLVRKAYESN